MQHFCITHESSQPLLYRWEICRQKHSQSISFLHANDKKLLCHEFLSSNRNKKQKVSKWGRVMDKKRGKRMKGEGSTYPLIQLQDSRVRVYKKKKRKKEQRNIKTYRKATNTLTLQQFYNKEQSSTQRKNNSNSWKHIQYMTRKKTN